MSEIISAQQLRSAAKGKVNEANMNSVLVALNEYGQRFGLHKPHRLAHFLAQIMHESGSFKYDKEIWGPTAAQKRYEGRSDLGNTQPGDGKRFMGRSAMQLTGRFNYRQFTKWCREQGINSPDFEAHPEKINTDPYEGLVPIWYWDSRSINKYADLGDIESVTRKINGGKNGLDDRIDYYGRIALVLLGYRADNVRQFQADRRLEVDGDVGPRTRAALHGELVALIPGEMAKPTVQVAPVVEQTTIVEEKPVVPVSVEKDVKKKFNLFGWLGGIISGGGLGVAGLAGFDWKAIVAMGGVVLAVFLVAVLLRQQIIAGVKELRAAVEQ